MHIPRIAIHCMILNTLTFDIELKSSTKMASSTTELLPHVDELILEYLLFRGFTKTFQALHAEKKRDRAKAFDAEQIITQLLTFVQTYQLDSVLETWKFLEARFFSRLDASYTTSIRQLEDSWLRLYVVNALKTGRRDKATDFFKQLIYANKLNARVSDRDADSWYRWFILPYVHTPETDPYFKSFFTKGWLESFVTSFRNFLSLIFRSIPLPKLLALQINRLQEPSVKLQLKASQTECSRLRVCTLEAKGRIQALEDANRQLSHSLQSMVQHSFAEHFSATSGSDAAVNSAKVMATLVEQLRTLNDALATRTASSDSADTALQATMLDPLHVKLHGATLSSALSPPSSTSERSAVSSASSEGDRMASYPMRLTQHQVIDNVVSVGRDLHHQAMCKYSPDASHLLVGRVGDDGFAVVHLNGESASKESIHAEAGIIDVDWVPNSKQLLYALQDGTVNIWDIAAKKRTFTISNNAEERHLVRLACARSKPLGAVILHSKKSDIASQVQFFTIQSDGTKVISTVNVDLADVVAVCWSSDGEMFAIGDATGQLTILSTSSNRPLCQRRIIEDRQTIATLCFSADAKSLLLMVAGEDRVLEFSTESLTEASTTSGPCTSYQLPAVPNGPLDVHCASSHIAVSLHGPTDDATIAVFEQGRSDSVVSCTVQVTKLVAVAWHPLDFTLATLTHAGQVITWKTEA